MYFVLCMYTKMAAKCLLLAFLSVSDNLKYQLFLMYTLTFQDGGQNGHQMVHQLGLQYATFSLAWADFFLFTYMIYFHHFLIRFFHCALHYLIRFFYCALLPLSLEVIYMDIRVFKYTRPCTQCDSNL